MTNERAIKLLNRISDSQFDGEYGDERREALSMAVRALEGDGDTISRKMAIDAVNDCGICIQKIVDLPSAQPERKTARWEILYPNHTYKYHCSECGANHKYMFDFCPSCGAYMGDENDAIS